MSKTIVRWKKFKDEFQAQLIFIKTCRTDTLQNVYWRVLLHSYVIIVNVIRPLLRCNVTTSTHSSHVHCTICLSNITHLSFNLRIIVVFYNPKNFKMSGKVLPKISKSTLQQVKLCVSFKRLCLLQIIFIFWPFNHSTNHF